MRIDIKMYNEAFKVFKDKDTINKWRNRSNASESEFNAFGSPTQDDANRLGSLSEFPHVNSPTDQ